MSVTYLDVARALAKPEDSFKAPQIQQVNWWIKVAQTKIRQHFLKKHVGFEELDPDTVDIVIVEAVARKVSNPKGKQNERIDDYSYGINPAEATSQITITPDEWLMLTPARESGAFTIRTDPGASSPPPYWGW